MSDMGESRKVMAGCVIPLVPLRHQEVFSPGCKGPSQSTYQILPSSGTGCPGQGGVPISLEVFKSCVNVAFEVLGSAG